MQSETWGQTGNLGTDGTFSIVLICIHDPAERSSANSNLPCSRLSEPLRRRPPFCGSSRREVHSSSCRTKSRLPKGRPVCVHARIARKSPSVSPESRYLDAIPESLASDHKAALKMRLQYGFEISLPKRLTLALKGLEERTRNLITDGDESFVERCVDTRNGLTHEGSCRLLTEGLEVLWKSIDGYVPWLPA